jgi:hypothetical protein
MTMTADSVDIWTEYKRTGDKRLRDRLILTSSATGCSG